MSNPLNVGRQQPDLNQLYQQFAQDPYKYLAQLNLPANIQTPQQAVEYFMSAGKVPPFLQGRVNAMLGRR